VTRCCQPLHGPSNASGTQRRTSQDEATGRHQYFSRHQRLAVASLLRRGRIVDGCAPRQTALSPRFFHQRLWKKRWKTFGVRVGWPPRRKDERQHIKAAERPRRRLSGRISIDGGYVVGWLASLCLRSRHRCQDMSVRDAPPSPKRLLILLVWLRPTGTCLRQIAAASIIASGGGFARIASPEDDHVVRLRTREPKVDFSGRELGV